VSDRDDILELVARYAHTVDERDVDGVVACFVPDGRMDFEGGATTAVGHDGIRAAFEEAFARPALRAPSASTHLMANTIVNVDGDAGHAETQAVAYLVDPGAGTLVTRGLRYSDDLRRDPAGGWRIAHRVHRCTWHHESGG
jgi:ketosteroid isomerase-like protein